MWAAPSQVFEQRRRFTVEEAYRLMDQFPDERWELIEGEIISKMGQKPQHAYVLQVLTRMLSAVFPGRVRIQSSITLPGPGGLYTEPEPDVVLVNKHAAGF